MTHTNAKSLRRLFAFLMIAILAVGISTAAEIDKKGGASSSLAKTQGTPSMSMLNINNVADYFRSDGQGSHSPSDQAGLFYPKGTTTAIYEDGFVWGARIWNDALHTSKPDQDIRVGGQTYNQGTAAGKVSGMGASAVAAAASDSRSRVYRIRRDYYAIVHAITDAELRLDAASINSVTQDVVTAAQMADVEAQYDTDWKNWPVDLGAPYIERNGIPGYQPPPAFSSSFTADDLIRGNYDEPGIAGSDPNSPADQVVWTVFNDFDEKLATGLYKSEPIGLEGQVTLWGYKRSDALGNVFFKRLKLINKGVLYADSMYISQWSDPDVGDFGDDLCGCDTTLSLGFAYNGGATDREYKKFNLAPAASGYDFLQGPLVNGAAGDAAIWNLQVVQGKKNLPMTAFVYFSAGSPISDPLLSQNAGSSHESSLQWYRMLRGLRPDLTGVPERSYPFPPGLAPGPFPLSGDPVKQTGFVDGLGTTFSFGPGDRRIILASGPFSMAPGDTQEVVMGTVLGIGSDRLSSVSVLKFNDVFAQNTYNALFAIPKPPKAPAVKFAELDGKVVFEWGSDLAAATDNENTVSMPGNYTFEGYNVYQLPSSTSSLPDEGSEARTHGKRLATYDLLSDPAVVLDLQADPASGMVLQKPIQFGSNSGITRFYVLDADHISDRAQLSNGTPYYVAVTAYYVTRSGYFPAALESSPIIYTVTPHTAQPGYTVTTTTGQNNGITHATGIGDASLYLKVVDPTRLTGASYTVGFYNKPDQFSASASVTGTDENDQAYTKYETSAKFTLTSEARTAVTYSLKQTNLDSLTGPITGTVLQLGPLIDSTGLPTGPVIKNFTMVTTLVGGLRFGSASGTWRTTDATQPLTSAILDDMAAGNVYFCIRTAANPGGEVVAPIGAGSYPWYLDRGATRLLSFQQDLTYAPADPVQNNTYAITDGFQFKIGNVTFSAPSLIGGWKMLVKVNPNTPEFLPPSGGTGGFTLFGDATDLASEAFGSGSAVTQDDLVQDLEFRFTGVRALRANGTSPEDTVIVSGGSIATVYSSNLASVARLRVPFELWENDANGRHRQINVAIRDRNADAKSPWTSSGVPQYMRIAGGRAYIQPIATAYNSDPSVANIAANGLQYSGNPKGTWAIVPRYALSASGAATSHWDTGDIVQLKFANTMTPGVDTYTWTTPTAQSYSADKAKLDAGHVNVFPNPYYAFNPLERNRLQRFVTFNGLPSKATLRIFNLAGQLVRTLQKNDNTQFQQWDLTNKDNFPVASGIYIAYVDMPDIGATKVVKIAIIQEQEVPNNF